MDIRVPIHSGNQGKLDRELTFVPYRDNSGNLKKTL